MGYMKYIVSVLILLIVGTVGEYLYMHYYTKTLSGDYKNTIYSIDGQTLVLKDGTGILSSPESSASKTQVTYFGDETVADFDAGRSGEKVRYSLHNADSILVSVV